MSVYIKNMELPKGYPVCIVIDAAGQARRYDLNNDRYADDELFEVISVPPHGRLIDADELANSITGVIYHSDLRDAPTIIPAAPQEDGT